jgi:hypothetical protein
MHKLLAINLTDEFWVRFDFSWLLVGLLVLVLLGALWRQRGFLWGKSSYFELDETEVGIGAGKLKLKANYDDLQVAFKFWTELSTRKIGLPFDEENDVVVEVYHSWYEFFRVARELIKSIPVTKYRHNESTKQIVRVSVLILNKALRPHLTKWQARYRRWWQQALADTANEHLTPQEIQKKYPLYQDLISDLKTVNAKLVRYTERLQELVER